MSKKKKIVIPTEEEVAEYAEKTPANEEPPKEDSTEQLEAGAEEAESATEAEPKSEAEEWKERFLRAKADLSNYQKRAQKDRTGALRYANADLSKALLPTLDDIERVMANSSEHTENGQAIIDGLKLTLENFLKVLESYHVTPIEAAIGQPFDPKVHEAMMAQPSEEYPERTVLQELAKGYRLHDRVLRPAKVIVSQTVEKAEADKNQADQEPLAEGESASEAGDESS